MIDSKELEAIRKLAQAGITEIYWPKIVLQLLDEIERLESQIQEQEREDR